MIGKNPYKNFYGEEAKHPSSFRISGDIVVKITKLNGVSREDFADFG
jgi:hypothetical protein